MNSAESRARGTWASVAIGLIVAGAVLRFCGWLFQGQLYIDDSRVALNIAARSYAALTQPLDYGQAAPIPFLWMVKLATQLGGTHDLALRAVPLIAGIAVVWFVWSVGRRAFGEEPALVATCFATFSPFLIRYSSAVKQYSTDALVTLLFVWLVLDVLRAGADRAAWLRLAIGGALAMWISHPAVFVLAGSTLALPVHTALRATPRWQRRYGVTVLVWAATFVALYAFIYRSGERDPFLKAAWEWTFLSPDAADFERRAGQALRAMLVPPVWGGSGLFGTPLVLGGITSLAFFAGLIAIARAQGPALAVVVSGPYGAVAGGAMLGQYPPADRLLIFAAPLLLFIYGSALWWAIQAAPPRARAPAVAAALLLITGVNYPAALDEGRNPKRRRETKMVLAAVDARAPEAPVYFFTPRASCTCAPWVLYTTDWRAPDTARLRRFARNWAETRPTTVTRTERATTAPVSWRAGGREEVIGAGAYIPYVPFPMSPDPDSAWVKRESQRIRDAANPMAWIWASEPFPESTIAALLRGIRQRGGRLIYALRDPGATAWQIEFPARAGPQ